MMAKATKLMPLKRHRRSQNPRVVYGLVDEVIAVVDALMRISVRTEGEFGSPAIPSQDLVDPVHRSARASFTDTDADDAIQECVCFRRGLEPRQRSKVVARGVDDLSTAEGGNGVSRAMAQPLKGHVDQRMIVRLQRDAQVQLENAVGAQQG